MTAHADMYMMEELIFALLPVLTSGIPTVLLGIASYVLSSLALHTMATRRGIRKAWLSWVPVLNVWILGSLSDQYRYVVKGQDKSKRKILLVLNLAKLVFILCLVMAVAVLAVDLIGTAMGGFRGGSIVHFVTGPLLGLIALGLPLAGLSVASAVFYYMALYDVYVSADPANSVLFTAMSILFSVTKPVFLFLNREKDGGMPPRRDQPRPEPETREYQ